MTKAKATKRPKASVCVMCGCRPDKYDDQAKNMVIDGVDLGVICGICQEDHQMDLDFSDEDTGEF